MTTASQDSVVEALRSALKQVESMLLPAADAETELRELLAAIPFDRLREIGVLGPLLGLVGRSDPAEADRDVAGDGDASSDDASRDLDTMSVEDLVRAATNG
jgi:hypothetical protein